MMVLYRHQHRRAYVLVVLFALVVRQFYVRNDLEPTTAVVVLDGGRVAATTALEETNHSPTMLLLQQEELLLVPENATTAWCLVNASSMWPGVDRWGWEKSIAHAGEALLPCWTFFHRAVKRRCGFLVQGLPKPPISWAQQIMQAMGCEIVAYESPQGQEIIAKKFWKHFPFQEEFWIQGPEDAASLRQQLQLPNKTSHKLRVGIVNRTKTRQFQNVTALASSLVHGLITQGGYATPDVSIETFDNHVPLQTQARWFATKDLIVAAHGAALINCVFIQPGTTVLQFFPKNYYFIGYFESLIQKVGGKNVIWYTGNLSTALNPHTQMKRNQREYAKKQPFLQPIDMEQVIPLTLEALAQKAT